MGFFEEERTYTGRKEKKKKNGKEDFNKKRANYGYTKGRSCNKTFRENF